MTAARPLRGPARGALVGGRRGRRRRELRRPAPHAAQRAVGRRRARGGPRDLVVGELRLRDHLPPAGRPLRPAERRCRRPVAARSRRRRGDVHAEPDQRGRRAADRGELGARRGRRRRPRDPRHASASTAPATVLERTPGLKKIAIRAAADGGTFEETVAPELVEQLCLDDDQLAQLERARRRSASEVYGPARDIEWAFAGGQLYLLQCRAVTRAGSSPRPAAPPAASGPVEVIERVPLFANMSPRDVEGIAALFKERRFAAGETITKEGAGGAAFFVIESGEATVSVGGQPRATLTERRLLRRDRADRRGRTLGDDHREHRARLLRAHLLGVPAARAAQRDHRLEPAPDAGQAAAHRAGRPAGVAAPGERGPSTRFPTLHSSAITGRTAARVDRIAASDRQCRRREG